MDYWRSSPPVHVLVRAYMGGGSSGSGSGGGKAITPTNEAELEAAIVGF
jgi:hypothetical protein